MKLTGTIRERVELALKYAGFPMNADKIEYFRQFYAEADVELTEPALEFCRRYGVLFADTRLIFEDEADEREFYFDFYPELPVPRSDKIRRLQHTMTESGRIGLFAKCGVCPVADIGYYYPATVFVGDDSLLYCIHEYEENIRVYNTMADLLERELAVHEPSGITFVK